MSFSFLSGLILIILQAGLALNTVGLPVKGLVPLRALVAGFLTHRGDDGIAPALKSCDSTVTSEAAALAPDGTTPETFPRQRNSKQICP